MDFLKLVDAYTARARLLPGLLTVLPIAAIVYAWDPGNPLGWNGFGALITGFGGTILLSFVARDLGKEAEKRLYKKWGGRPTELTIMYSGSMDSMLRTRRHAAIHVLFPGVVIPSAEEEADDRDAVYQRFTAITKLLIARARDKAQFPLLFEGLCNYGFRRNMYGMRWIGMSIAGIASVALGLQVLGLFASHSRLSVLSLAIEAVNLAMLIAWISWVNEKAVRKGSDLYADRLFETLDTVPIPA